MTLSSRLTLHSTLHALQQWLRAVHTAHPGPPAEQARMQLRMLESPLAVEALLVTASLNLLAQCSQRS